MDIQFKDVGYKYKGIKVNYDALNHINLTLDEKDEFVAIIGHTGSGKSTLVQHMNALLLPTSGTLNVLGQILPPQKNEKINHLRQKVGLVFQFPEYQLFEETILKDIMFGPKNFKSTEQEALEKAKKAATIVGITEELYEQSPFRISGGQMRRVAIAGILAMEPKILVLDEPTRGLDPRGRKDLMKIFKELHEVEHKSIVLISHDMDVVSEYAKRVIVLEEGEIVFDGKKEDLFEHPNFESFHLDLPTPLRILKHLEKEINLPYQPKYDFDSLLQYLKEVGYE
ncbi:energy-coupling factor transporter ATPase [Mariniplasma anaerobium]|uniref:Energy-coupling factor transporter ATP-binding protein EcfA2 n=1 Tax=Mariniplasma anaerobium TaxID=2735436 RepID=A0A7U9XVZ9_9MOLU|nr:energy-coupling factor transporter ATPase [Mariniplasma anaerobium]BCR35368.1 energy-coupling factor transporter ATP-binding protein EcfA2 [Mariniplasma anaerobium]